MDFTPHPSVIERRMDDQSVLARRAPVSAIASMHEDIALLYREQLVTLLRRIEPYAVDGAIANIA